MLAEPRCFTRGCRHFLGVRQEPSETELDERAFCSAFPDGIPADIAYGYNAHTAVDERQDGTDVYEPHPDFVNEPGGQG
jgi:hypothetical protein